MFENTNTPNDNIHNCVSNDSSMEFRNFNPTTQTMKITIEPSNKIYYSVTCEDINGVSATATYSFESIHADDSTSSLSFNNAYTYESTQTVNLYANTSSNP